MQTMQGTRTMMKVLQIPTGGLMSDGICNCIFAYLSNMDQSGVQFDIIATNVPDEKVVASALKCNLSIKRMPSRKRKTAAYFVELYKLIKNEKYDIVHVHGSSGIMALDLLAAKMAGCSVRIAPSHNTLCENKKADKVLRPIFNQLYTVAFACGDEAGKWLFGQRSFIILPNGRNLEKLAYSPEKRHKIRQEWGVDDGTMVFGHVGKLKKQKNHHFLIEVFREIKKINADAKLVLVGTGELVGVVKKQIADYGLQQDVILTGQADNIPELLSAMDVMLLPSLYEGLPLVVIEWQAAGLPCIISDVITDECVVEPNVIKLNLKDEPVKWAKEALQIPHLDREQRKEIVKQDLKSKGFDIKADAELLKKLYLKYTGQ